MELTTAMLADGAHQADGKLYVLGGQWDRLIMATFPAQHPTMALVLVIRVEYTEALRAVDLGIDLTLDGESRGISARVRFETGHAPGSAPGAPSFVQLAITFNNVMFAAPGRYEWVVKVGDDELGRIPLAVMQGTRAVPHPAR
jgi:hypothetical protein